MFSDTGSTWPASTGQYWYGGAAPASTGQRTHPNGPGPASLSSASTLCSVG